MENSCAVFYTDGFNILICHPTGSGDKFNWSLPKGLQDENELESITAARELHEETNIKINYKDLKYINTFPYRKNKKLTLFLYKTKSFPTYFKCTSYFYDKILGTLPEVDDWKVIPIDIACKFYLNIPQQKIIQSVLKNYMEKLYE